MQTSRAGPLAKLRRRFRCNRGGCGVGGSGSGAGGGGRPWEEIGLLAPTEQDSCCVWAPNRLRVSWRPDKKGYEAERGGAVTQPSSEGNVLHGSSSVCR